MENTDFSNVLYVIYLGKDFYGYYDFKKFQLECSCAKIPILYLVRERYQDGISFELGNNVFNIGEGDPKETTKAFYETNKDKILNFCGDFNSQ